MTPDIPIMPSAAPTGPGKSCLANSCSRCCYDTEMLLSDADIARLESKGHKRADFAVLDQDGYYTLKNVYDTPGRHTAEILAKAEEDHGHEHAHADGHDHKHGGHCVFLVNEMCSVYGDRPQGCRYYPWTLDHHGLRAIRDDECPHSSEFPIDAAAGRKMKILVNNMVREARSRQKAGVVGEKDGAAS